MVKSKYNAVALVLVILLVLSACGSRSPKGSYKSDSFISQTWTFYNGNKLKVTTIGGVISFEGAYEIDGNEIIVHYTVLGESITLQYAFENRGQKLVIDGSIYTKI